MNPLINIKQASASYPVFVGRDLLGRVGELVHPKGRVFVITSHALRERFGHRVAASFEPRAEICVSMVLSAPRSSFAEAISACRSSTCFCVLPPVSPCRDY